MINSCGCSFDIILQYGYIKTITYIVTFVRKFCKFAVVWPNFDVVAMFGEALWRLFSCISNRQDFVLGMLCSVNYFFVLAVSNTFCLLVMFNYLLVMSFTDLFSGKVWTLYKVLNRNEVADCNIAFQKESESDLIFW